MSNPNNFGSVVGNLASAPKIMPHANGTSGTALITLYARNNYRSKDGSTGSVRVDLEEFISDVNKPGAYAFLGEGMLVSVNYSVANADYTAKDGQQVYGMKLQVNRGGIQIWNLRQRPLRVKTVRLSWLLSHRRHRHQMPSQAQAPLHRLLCLSQARTTQQCSRLKLLPLRHSQALQDNFLQR